MTDGQAEPYRRPRLTEREGRLLLAAVHRWRKAERDVEIERLYNKLLSLWGDG